MPNTLANLDTFRETDFSRAHAKLARFNRRRLDPKFPSDHWRAGLRAEHEHRVLEVEILEKERALVAIEARRAPREKNAFMTWFENLKLDGPGQNSPLFPWLATTADRARMTWFIRQEIAGEAGFEDLTALTQIKFGARPKLEMARNYWDEMGRGREPGMHGPMLARVADELGIGEPDPDEALPEAVALGNVMLGMAVHREYAYHSVGALGAVELTAPGRAALVFEGLKRLGISREGQRYYHLHSTLDLKHSEEWNREVLAPLLEENPDAAVAIAEGALMRLNAGARCFERYLEHFGLSAPCA